jgi:formate dehydrogenase major subunit
VRGSSFCLFPFAFCLIHTAAMLAELLLKWPLIRQITQGGDGTGAEAMSEATRNLRPKNDGASVARSICPYCGVGCGQLVFHREGKIVNIEGDPQSPISRGHLCPKGAASFELLTHPRRSTTVKYRAPRSREWRDMSVEEATRLVAHRVWETRQRTFDDEHQHTTGLAHLGGATLDVEENYLIKKLFTAGLGMVCLSNQARI